MAQFQYNTTTNLSDIIINSFSLLATGNSKQNALTPVSPIPLDNSGNWSINLSNYAHLNTNGSYKEIAFDNVIKIASDSINSFYIEYWNGAIWKSMAQFQYNTTTNLSHMIINRGSELTTLNSKQIALTPVSPILLDNSGNLSLDPNPSYTVGAQICTNSAHVSGGLVIIQACNIGQGLVVTGGISASSFFYH